MARRTSTTTNTRERVLRSTINAGITKTTSNTASRNLRPRKPTPAKHPSKRRVPKPLPSYLQPTSGSSSPSPNSDKTTSHFPLLSLPRELVRYINSFLPSSSQVCLSLTCKTALHIIGTSVWSACRNPANIRSWDESFAQASINYDYLLKKLSKDSRSSRARLSPGTGPLEHCSNCLILHPGKLKRPQEHKITKYTRKCFGINGFVDYLPFASGYKTGYSLVWDHIRHVIEAGPPRAAAGGNDEKDDVEYLSGRFEMTDSTTMNLGYDLSSTARWIKGNLVLKHQHVFRSLPRPPPPHGHRRKGDQHQYQSLLIQKVMALPLRICPHQSTVTDLTDERAERKRRHLNGPLFIRSLLQVFPEELRRATLKGRRFKTPTSSEQQYLDALDRGEQGLVFGCRSCVTKWKVEYVSASGELKVTAWHCFYGDILSAKSAWMRLVRREAYNLTEKTRNSEYWSVVRTMREFQTE